MQALRLMAALEGLCVRESAGKITPTLRARLHALQKEIAAARAQQDAARAVQVDSEFHWTRAMRRLQQTT